MNTAQEGCRTNPRTYSKAEYDELSVKFAALEAENAKLRAELERLQVDGYVMAPVEPTDAMKLAGNDALAQHWGAGDAYRAMLAASRLPVQPVQGMSNRSKRLDEIRAIAERMR